jgi:hypothetical protein
MVGVGEKEDILVFLGEVGEVWSGGKVGVKKRSTGVREPR